ncbi:leucine-rich repeat domain-containing protein [Tenacibaculum sp. nBUS_03]|uniref:leucine-rich repeat domain-containing protein n=1 Tax=Tenacibaculum sp. nBUS_03 TaxID=3395320 RepID=UPI003EB79895
MKIYKILIILVFLFFAGVLSAQDLKEVVCDSEAIYELKASQIEEDAVVLNWFSMVDTDEYVIIYGLKGFDHKNKRARLGKIRTNQEIEIFTGLRPRTAYDFYVKLKCHKRRSYKKITVKTLKSKKNKRRRSARVSSRMARSMSSFSVTLEEEKQALWDLYQSTNGSQWKNTLANNKPWSLDKPVSEWKGITLDNEGHVNKINLGYNNLEGALPSSISKLTRLNYINLIYNKISSIPSEIGSLNELNWLQLSRNSISNIPDDICNITKLKHLFLDYNKITILPDNIGQLENLRGLYLAGNQISSLPNSIENLSYLTGIDLSYNKLSGAFPVQILKLTNLVILELSGNSYSGKIPESIGTLTKLSALIVAQNQFSGELPNSIFSLKKLTALYFSGNNLTGQIPEEIGNLTGMFRLGLRANNLEGTIPLALSNLKKLHILELDHNSLSGSIPSGISSLEKLFYLALNNNKLEGNIPASIGSLTKLKYLWLFHNKLTGSIPSGIVNLTELVNLQVNDNNLSGVIPSGIALLSKLNRMHIDENNFVFSDFENDFSKYKMEPNFTYSPQSKVDIVEEQIVETGKSITLSSLVLTSSQNSYQWYKNGVAISGATSKDLVLNNVQESDAGVYHFRATNSVVSGLTLERNPITLTVTKPSCQVSEIEKNALWSLYNATNGANWKNTIAGNKPWSLDVPVCDWFGVQVDDSGNVTNLTLYNNDLEGSLPAEIGVLNHLKMLNLTLNKLTGLLPDSIGNLTSLNALFLGDNKLNGAIPASLSNLIGLAFLDLQKNNLSGSIPGDLGMMVNLKLVSFSNNELSGGIPISLGNLIKLNQLYLDNNNLSGSIPSSFGNLVAITHLNLSGNELTGSLPTSLGAMKEMVQLFLQWNKLSGNIPPTLGSLTKLTSVYLNNNQLTGNIPDTFVNLNNLYVLFLSNNNLSGQLPVGLGQMNKLEYFDIEHNKFSGNVPSILNAQLKQVKIRNNSYVFSDFEDKFTSYKQLVDFTYTPQSKVDVLEEKLIESGKSITLSSLVLTSSQNSYQWYKNGVAISGATSKDLILNNVQESDAGVYHFTATNSVVSGLTLERNPITLLVSHTPVITPVPLATVESTPGGSFRPSYNKKYMISGWVKEKSTTGIKISSYKNSAIRLYTVGLASGSLEEPVFIGDFYPTGNIIDGWQRIEGVFKIESFSHSDATAVNNLVIELKNTSADITSYFDDIRVYPFNGSIKSFVYDNNTKKLMAELDENNFATYYEYDNEGGLVRVKKETKKGIFTIQETRSSNAK